MKFFVDFTLLLKYVMFEMLPALVHGNFYQGLIHFGITLIIILEEYFMLDLSRQLHFSIIVCFVLIICFCSSHFLIGFRDFQL